MTEQEYNQAEGVRRSDLWKMEDSPEKFKYFSEHPAEQTPAMAFGAGIHKAILEPDTFEDEFAVAPRADKRTKEGKAVWEAFMAENAGKTLLPCADVDVMREMVVALEQCPLAKKLMWGKGENETPFFWTDKETGEKCKVKLDRFVKFNRRWYVIDYKTATCAETNKFNSSIWKFGYHLQAAMYTEGVRISKKLRKRPGFLFVVQEKNPPYSVNVVEVSEEVMAAGNAKFHQLLEKYHACRVIDQWPGYLTDNVPNDAFVPTWMQEVMDDDV